VTALRVNSRLKEILDERGISIRKAAADTGIQFESLRRLYNNETERFPREMLAKLCTYLNVDIPDLLKLDRQE
jgi:DNA-binding Xre family transcriptional regulator